MPARRRAGGGGRRALARLIGGLLALALPLLPAPAAASVPAALDSGSVRVVYWPGDRPLAERALRIALAPGVLPGLPPRRPAVEGTIILAPSEAVFDSLTHGAPAWSAGVAIPGLRRIILPAYASARTPLGDPIQALRHEIAHLALHAYLPEPIPRWFDEGYATWTSEGLGEDAAWRIRLALLRRDGARLDSLTLDWPRGEARAHTAYLLSATAVQHLATRSGERAFTALLVAWREQGTLDAALRSTYLITLGHFEDEWVKVVRNRYGWLLAASQIGAFWLLLVLLLLLLVGPRRRRNRARLAALRAEERMLPPPREDGVDEEYPIG